MLNDDDLKRYARQVIIPNFEEDGQENLLDTRCLIVGAGGLGCPVALYASAAGFGYIEIYDEDIIEISNLNRQIAHKNDHIGNNKAENLDIFALGIGNQNGKEKFCNFTGFSKNNLIVVSDNQIHNNLKVCLLYTSPSPRD